MLAVGIFLAAVGLCDLLRAARDASSVRRRALVTGTGLAVLVLLLVPAGMDGTEWLGLGLGLGVSLACWTLGASASLGKPPALERGRRPAALRFVALVGLLAGLLIACLGGAVLDQGHDWPAALDDGPLAQFPLDEVVVTAGVFLVQLSTANLVIRLVLDAVGVPATSNEKQLKGGRVLGPMERVLILGLGIAGSLTAASVVVAAKGLLRFPELQREVAGELATDGPGDVTEYFLIGSFASWLLALGGVAIVWLT
jgi:hypothetical protein